MRIFYFSVPRNEKLATGCNSLPLGVNSVRWGTYRVRFVLTARGGVWLHLGRSEIRRGGILMHH